MSQSVIVKRHKSLLWVVFMILVPFTGTSVEKRILEWWSKDGSRVNWSVSVVEERDYGLGDPRIEPRSSRDRCFD